MSYITHSVPVDKNQSISIKVTVTDLQIQCLGSSFSFSSPTVQHHQR